MFLPFYRSRRRMGMSRYRNSSNLWTLRVQDRHFGGQTDAKLFDIWPKRHMPPLGWVSVSIFFCIIYISLSIYVAKLSYYRFFHKTLFFPFCAFHWWPWYTPSFSFSIRLSSFIFGISSNGTEFSHFNTFNATYTEFIGSNEKEPISQFLIGITYKKTKFLFIVFCWFILVDKFLVFWHFFLLKHENYYHAVKSCRKISFSFFLLEWKIKTEYTHKKDDKVAGDVWLTK